MSRFGGIPVEDFESPPAQSRFAPPPQAVAAPSQSRFGGVPVDVPAPQQAPQPQIGVAQGTFNMLSQAREADLITEDDFNQMVKGIPQGDVARYTQTHINLLRHQYPGQDFDDQRGRALAIMDIYKAESGRTDLSSQDFYAEGMQRRAEERKETLAGRFHNAALGVTDSATALGTGALGLVAPETARRVRDNMDLYYNPDRESWSHWGGQTFGEAAKMMTMGAAMGIKGMAGTYAATGAGEARIRVAELREQGLDISGLAEAVTAAGVGMVEGASGALSGAIIGRAARMSQPLADAVRANPRQIAPYARQAVAALGLVGGEAAEEAAVTVATNLIYSGIDPEQALIEGVLQAAATGAMAAPFGARGARHRLERQVRRPISPVNDAGTVEFLAARSEAEALRAQAAEAQAAGNIEQSQALESQAQAVENQVNPTDGSVPTEITGKLIDNQQTNVVGDPLAGAPLRADRDPSTFNQQGELFGDPLLSPIKERRQQQDRETRVQVEQAVQNGDIEGALNIIAEAKARAEWDASLNIANKNAFANDLRVTEQYADSQNKTVQVAQFDAANMKAGNDLLGHSGVDTNMATMVRAMQAELGDEGVFYRTGGDEFTVLFHPDVTADRAAELTAKMSAAAGETSLVPGKVSMFMVGTSRNLSPGQRGADVLAQADAALDHAKLETKRSRGEVTERSQAEAAVKAWLAGKPETGPIAPQPSLTLDTSAKLKTAFDDQGQPVNMVSSPVGGRYKIPAPHVYPDIAQNFFAGVDLVSPTAEVNNLAENLLVTPVQPSIVEQLRAEELAEKSRTPEQKAREVVKAAKATRRRIPDTEAHSDMAPPNTPTKAPSLLGRLFNRVGRMVPRGLEDYITPIMSRVMDLSPAIGFRLTKLESDAKKNSEDTKRSIEQPVRDIVQSLGGKKSAEYQRFAHALRNGDFDLAKSMLTEEAAKSFDHITEVLSDLHQSQVEAGLDLGFTENYWPMRVKDIRGLRAVYGNDTGVFQQAWAEAEAAKGRPLSESEQVHIANQVVAGYGPRKPGAYGAPHMRSRQSETVPFEAMQHYSDPMSTVFGYVDTATYAVARAEFFGKGVRDSDALHDSVGDLVRSEVEAGRLDVDAQQEMKQLLSSRFAADMAHMNTTLQAARSMIHILTLGQIRSAITQMTELGLYLHEHGVRDTIRGAARAAETQARDLFYLSPRDKTVVMDHLGLKTYGEEFSESAKLGRATRTVFKWSLFRAADKFAKESRMNAASASFSRAANNPDSAHGRRFAKKYREAFGDQWSQLVTDLQEGRQTDLTRVLHFMDVMQTQPISLSAMPRKYLDAPNGRIMYTLKTFTIQHLNMMRRDMFRKMRTPGERKEGLRNLAIYMLGFWVLNMGRQTLTDLVRGRPLTVDSISDNMVTSLFAVSGLTRYLVGDFARNPSKAVSAFLAPPLPLINEAWRDVNAVVTPPDEFTGVATSRYIPVVGDLINFWTPLGRGHHMDRKNAKTQYRDELKKVRQQAEAAFRDGDRQQAIFLLGVYNERRLAVSQDGGEAIDRRKTPLSLRDLQRANQGLSNE